MFDLNSISNAKSKASQNYEKLNKDLEEELKTGIKYFKEFSQTHSVQTLRKAMDKFFSYIQNKRTKVEPFFYIAFSAYLVADQGLAEKYLKYAREIDPAFPYLEQLKSLIINM
jgi:hypothetical protein